MKTKANRELKVAVITSPVNREKTALNNLQDAYAEHYSRYIELSIPNEPFPKNEHGKRVIPQNVLQLGADSRKNLKETLARVEGLANQGIYCNDSLKLWIKELILHGKYLTFCNLTNSASQTYKVALDELKKYINRMDFKKDLNFQQQVEMLFDCLDTMVKVNSSKEIENDVAILREKVKLLITPNPEFELLEQLEEELLSRAKLLKLKLTAFHDEFFGVMNQEIGFAKNRVERFNDLSHIVLDFYELIQQRALLQSGQAKSLSQWQEGRPSRTEFRKVALDIHSNIDLIKILYNKIKTRNDDDKSNTIYKLGLDAFKNYQSQPSREQIMKKGAWVLENNRKTDKNANNFCRQWEFLDLLQFHFLSLDYLQTKIKPYLFENYNEGLNQLSHFKEKKAEFPEGKFYGLLALTLKDLHTEDGDLNHLRKALVYAGKSYDYYQKKNDKLSLGASSYQLARIADKLAAQDPSNLGLKSQARIYYQTALDFYNQSDYELKPAQLKEIQDRIEALQDENPNAAQLTSGF